ncbi:hypothetical protein [Aeromonas veronii]
MTQHTQLEAHLLNSSGLLNYLEQLKFSAAVNKTAVENGLFISFHHANRYQPDHIAYSKLQELHDDAAKQHLHLGPVLALKRISEQYFDDRNECSVKLPLFGYWQSLIARLSPLPIQAAFYAKKNSNSDFENYQFRWPLYPYHPSVEDYISQNKLNESHQHLNGSSNAESCWLDALRKPLISTNKFNKEYNTNPRLRQLCAQISLDLSPAVLFRRLELAAYIRNLLAKMVYTKIDDCFNLSFLDDSKQIPLKSISPNELVNFRSEAAKLKYHWPTSSPFSDTAEFNLMQSIMRCYFKNPKQPPLAERLLWIYLLIQNQYLTLLVQRDDFYGFDQFQKYTFTELRDFTELEYLVRFKQAHGYKNATQIGFLEGRFAPKKDKFSFEELLTKILGGYLNYLQPSIKVKQIKLTNILQMLRALPPEGDKAKLALVIHFIKKPTNTSELYPFKNLYINLAKQAALLTRLLKVNPELKRWIRGIDAAANEMDTPPEVFAPLFRVLKAQGIKHVTYHVGEDFSHLVSGIRAIDDAIRFLPLCNGDRLGHCTGIGITPALWRRSLPQTINIKKETHLLDLIFTWRILRHNHTMLKWANIAASEAITLAKKIFKRLQIYSIEQLDELYCIRDYYPNYEPLMSPERWHLRSASVWDDEYKRIDNLIFSPEKKSLLTLYQSWLFDQAVRVERNAMLTLPTNWLPDDAIIALQQAVMSAVAIKNIAIESPPTSNTRISQYVEVKEHHVFRWMGLPEHTIQGDTPMSVCLASDDPGIFVTDIKAEFYHLFSILTQQMQLSPHDALSHVSILNENGRIFRFHTQY